MSARRLREDVHIHAPAAAVFAHVADLGGYAEWLPRTFSAVAAQDEHIEFLLTLPGCTQPARLAVAAREAPAYLELAADAGAEPSAVEALSWAVSPEGPREVHLAVELAYRPAGGLLGGLAEPSLHGPLRRQALRDALWRLKQRVEAATRGG